MLTGATKYRLGWRGKIVLQVAYWQRTFQAGCAPWLGEYKSTWRDATFQDVIDLERRNFSVNAPAIEQPPGTPRGRK